MKQYPSKTKFKKYHKANFSYSSIIERKSFSPVFGLSGIQALESGVLTYRQIEACRRTLRRGLKKTGKIWICAFTYVPVTKKPVAARMGKGKGGISHWVAPVRKGQILFEITEWNPVKSMLILNKALSRLPFNAKVVFTKY